MKINIFNVLLLFLPFLVYTKETKESIEDVLKNSLPTIEVTVPFTPSVRFYPQKSDFLTLFPEEPYFKPDTLNSKNINSKSTEGITPLLSLFFIDSDSITTKRSSKTIELTKKYLGLGANPNIQSNLGFTPLMKACELGMKDAALLLLDNKANPNLRNYQNRAALHFASRSGNLELVKILYSFKSDPKAIDLTGRKPVFDSKTHEIITYLKEKSGMNQEERFILSVIENDTIELSKFILEGVNINISFSDRKNALMYACENSNMNVIRKLISSGINIDAVDFRGDNALFYAVKNGNVDIIKYLIENKNDIDCQNKHNETPLIIAVKYNKNEIVRLLMENGADVALKDVNGYTALEWAFKIKYQDIIVTITELSENYDFNTQLLFRAINEDLYNLIDIIINKGHDLNLTNEKGQTPLFASILLKKYKLALKFIKQKVDLNIPSDYKTTPLMLAIEYTTNSAKNLKGYEGFTKQFKDYQTYVAINYKKIDPEINLVDTLIKYGANINPKDLDSSPLIASIFTANFSLVKHLIETGCDINYPDKDKTSPLQYLLSTFRDDPNLLDYVKYFHLNGAYLNWKNVNSSTVFMYAVSSNNIEVVKYIYANLLNPDVDFIDTKGVTALFYSIKNNNIEMAKYLLDLGADINISSKLSYEQNNYKLLHQGIWSGDEINIFLIENGIDIKQTFYNKMTPLMLACQQKRIKTVNKLLEAGADPSQKDKWNNTAFVYASNTKEILDILNKYKK